MIALGATKKYRSTHEHDGISFKSVPSSTEKLIDIQAKKEGKKGGWEEGRKETL